MSSLQTDVIATLRQRTVGEIIDAVFRLYRRNIHSSIEPNREGEQWADDPNLSAVGTALSALGDSLDAASGEGMPGMLAGQPAIDALNKVLSDAIFDYTRSETPLQKLARWLAGLTGEADPGDTLWRWFLSIVAGLAGGALTYLATDRIRNRWARFGVSALAGLAVALLFYYGAGALD